MNTDRYSISVAEAQEPRLASFPFLGDSTAALDDDSVLTLAITTTVVVMG